MSSETAVPADVDGWFAARAWLHVAALSAVAVAQPLLDLLGSSPEFFVAHHAGRIDILLLTAGLVLVLPAMLTKNLKIEANDCTLFDGEVVAGWSATLPLARCNVAAEGLTLRFTTAASRGDRDRRRLGAAVSRVTLAVNEGH